MTDVQQWAAWGSAMVSDANGRAGAMAGRIRPLSGAGVVGPAFTVRVVPGDSATLHLALEHVTPGTVLVVDAAGFPDRAVWGEILTRAAMVRGVAGIVVDGAIRDLAAITRLNFPVFAVGTCPAGPHKAGGGAWQVPVSCGGVVVNPGDLVIGDADGVTVVPGPAVDQVREAAHQRRQAEDHYTQQIEQGVTTAQLFGLRPQTPAAPTSGQGH
jgi:4-hydroxy-4-methyl-2-oxoglutarate aldolase